MANKRSKYKNNTGVLHTGKGTYIVKTEAGETLAEMDFIYNDEVQDDLMDYMKIMEETQNKMQDVQTLDTNSGKMPSEEQRQAIKDLRKILSNTFDDIFKIVLLSHSYEEYLKLTHKNTAMKQELHALLFSYISSAQYALRKKTSNKYKNIKSNYAGNVNSKV